jgi:hypothetical protein
MKLPGELVTSIVEEAWFTTGNGLRLYLAFSGVCREWRAMIRKLCSQHVKIVCWDDILLYGFLTLDY